MRAAAASVTSRAGGRGAKAIFASLLHGVILPPPASPSIAALWLSGLALFRFHHGPLAQPRGGRGDGIGRVIDLRRRRETAKPQADRGVGPVVGQSQRAQHIGWLNRGRG